MTNRQIETSREIRLWLGQILIPTLTLTTMIIASNPDARQAVANKFTNMKKSAKDHFKKGEK